MYIYILLNIYNYYNYYNTCSVIYTCILYDVLLYTSSNNLVQSYVGNFTFKFRRVFHYICKL